jgi:prevent-host-death family protein
MTSVGLLEAKTNLSALVDRASAGEEITITRHGRPAARLMPLIAFDRDKARDAFERLLKLREGMTLGGLDWKELRDESRK